MDTFHYYLRLGNFRALYIDVIMRNTQMSSPVIMRHLMAPTSPSRNPFADPNIPSLVDVIARIEAATELALRTRQNWCWALRAIARAAGTEPAMVPAHPEFLRKVLERAAPASLGMTRAGWNNARSLLGKALEWADLAS